MSTPLGDFLRARRDATPPETVGVSPGARRRVPGLRRSELAELAGISVEYLVRIEQGRDRNPSISVINALADALRLDDLAREHLRYLSKVSSGACPRAAESETSYVVRDSVRQLLQQFEPGIALVTNRLGDVLAATSGFELLTRPAGVLDGPNPNLTRWVFTDPRAREILPDWETMADECAFDLGRGPAVHRAALFSTALLEEAGDDFRHRMHQYVVPRKRVLEWRHAEAGELRFQREPLELPEDNGQRIVVFLPADDTTAAAMNKLRRTDGNHLRAVN